MATNQCLACKTGSLKLFRISDLESLYFCNNVRCSSSFDSPPVVVESAFSEGYRSNSSFSSCSSFSSTNLGWCSSNLTTPSPVPSVVSSFGYDSDISCLKFQQTLAASFVQNCAIETRRVWDPTAEGDKRCYEVSEVVEHPQNNQDFFELLDDLNFDSFDTSLSNSVACDLAQNGDAIVKGEALILHPKTVNSLLGSQVEIHQRSDGHNCDGLHIRQLSEELNPLESCHSDDSGYSEYRTSKKNTVPISHTIDNALKNTPTNVFKDFLLASDDLNLSFLSILSDDIGIASDDINISENIRKRQATSDLSLSDKFGLFEMNLNMDNITTTDTICDDYMGIDKELETGNCVVESEPIVCSSGNINSTNGADSECINSEALSNGAIYSRRNMGINARVTNTGLQCDEGSVRTVSTKRGQSSFCYPNSGFRNVKIGPPSSRGRKRGKYARGGGAKVKNRIPCEADDDPENMEHRSCNSSEIERIHKCHQGGVVARSFQQDQWSEAEIQVDSVEIELHTNHKITSSVSIPTATNKSCTTPILQSQPLVNSDVLFGKPNGKRKLSNFDNSALVKKERKDKEVFNQAEPTISKLAIIDKIPVNLLGSRMGPGLKSGSIGTTNLKSPFVLSRNNTPQVMTSNSIVQECGKQMKAAHVDVKMVISRELGNGQAAAMQRFSENSSIQLPNNLSVLCNKLSDLELPIQSSESTTKSVNSSLNNTVLKSQVSDGSVVSFLKLSNLSSSPMINKTQSGVSQPLAYNSFKKIPKTELPSQKSFWKSRLTDVSDLVRQNRLLPAVANSTKSAVPKVSSVKLVKVGSHAYILMPVSEAVSSGINHNEAKVLSPQGEKVANIGTLPDNMIELPDGIPIHERPVRFHNRSLLPSSDSIPCTLSEVATEDLPPKQPLRAPPPDVVRETMAEIEARDGKDVPTVVHINFGGQLYVFERK